MAKLPTALLPRSLPSTTSTSSTTTPLFTCSATHRPTFPSSSPSSPSPFALPGRPTQQVRHATEVLRPKRPFTWTQVVQLSDGSTYTSRSTHPVPVYRSTKDSRNHLRWQPTEASLQNVEVDEAGKLASFRKRFGEAFDAAQGPVAPAPARSAEEEGRAAAVRSGKSGKKKAGELKKAEEAEAAAAKAAEKAAEVDSFSDLLASYVVEQPHLKGGKLAGKDPKKGKKK